MSSAFQPLYRRFLHILCRRACLFTVTITFMSSSLRYVIARDVVFLNVMGALTGVGRGGLMTTGMCQLQQDWSTVH